MALKLILDSLDSLEDQQKSLYEERDGKFHLLVEGAVEKSKLDEFRSNNIELRKQLDDIKQKTSGIDLNKLKEMQELERKAREKELIEKGEVDTLINERVKGLTSDYDAKLSEKEKLIQTQTRQLESLLIDNVVRKLATEKGVLPTAVDDVLLRAKSTFTLKDGKPVAADSDGNILYGRDAVTPLSVEEWMISLREKATHLFHQPKGSGAPAAGTHGDPRGGAKTPAGKIASGLGKLRS